MQLTKFHHACFSVTKDGETIVVDPGEFSTDFVSPDTVVAVIVTHQHADHFDIGHIQAIADRNPDMVVFAHESVTEQIDTIPTHAVNAGDNVMAGNFSLTFVGGTHAVVDVSIPPLPNLGVLINDSLYYPGDSFALPTAPVTTLALPAAAPWLKASEAIEFMVAVKPRAVFPTHDAILSDEGKMIYDRLYEHAAKQNNINYQRITTPIEI
jgi:L-ascorbate metabolism protein UlaG (beta-lactamase superfamily)